MTILDSDKSTQALALKSQNPSWGHRRIADKLGWDYNKVRRAIEHAERKGGLASLRYETALPFHPLANLFPLIEGREFDELVASIKTSGLRDPIIVHDGQVLDGRNRQNACRSAEVDARYELLAPDQEPLAFVIDKNLRRRQLNDDQRRMVAARLASLGRGRPTENTAECGISRKEAARLLSVDEAGVERAKTVIAKAAPEVKAAVDRGKLTVAAAAQATKLDTGTQRKIAAEAEAGHANVVRTVIKKETRVAREADLGARQRALPDEKFGVILADPEWKHKAWSDETGEDRSASQHYPTNETEVIASRPVGSIAAPDCALFLWGTASMLPDALRVMEAWGFTYKTHFIWAKDRPGAARGMGRWLSDEHELLLLGTRGSVPAPTGDLQHRSVFHAPVGEHSEKPECFLAMIEEYFPTLPKIELNRRGPAREGWSAWGNQAGEEAA